MYKREARTGVIFDLTKSEKHGILNKSSGESDRRTGTAEEREKAGDQILNRIIFQRDLEKIIQKNLKNHLTNPKKCGIINKLSG